MGAATMALAIEDLDTPADDGEWQATDARIGQLIGGTYRLTRHLGSGGSSHVYAAEHARLGSPVAVKLLRPEIGTAKKTAQRFRREASALARIRSQHVVTVLDCGELDDRTPYLVMELLQGEDLRGLLVRAGKLPLGRATQIVVEACHGLTSVHAAGLVHRDIKPENLFITRRAGGEDWCKVLDFGAVKMHSSLSTAEGAIIGTARYMAPEQLASDAEVGPATDVYALGAILYESISGRPLHDGASMQQVMYRVMNDEPKSLASLCPDLPRQFVEVATRSISKVAKLRPQTTAELASSLLAALRDSQVSRDQATIDEEAPPVLETSRGAAAPARRRWLAPALVGCAVGAAVGWWTHGYAAKEPAFAPASRSPQPTTPLGARDTASARDSEVTRHLRAEPPLSQPSPASAPSAPAIRATVEAPGSPRAGARLRQVSAASGSSRPASGEVPLGQLDVANPYGE
jgi:eukaryotic-like serine/threonine-protein kinase